MRRLTTSALTVGLVLMAWLPCASGVMTMSEVVCCAEQQHECEMAGMAESCCGTDQHAGIGMLEPERGEDAPALADLTTVRPIPANVRFLFTPSLLAGSGVGSRDLFSGSRTRPHLARTVLLI